jgi:hypothetical protein
VFLDLTESRREQFLWARAYFKGVDQPVNLRHDDVRSEVKMAAVAPPIRFDPSTGSIEALREGAALIETSYDGVVGTTCVLVGDSVHEADCSALAAGNAPSPPETASPSSRFRSPESRRFMADDRVEIGEIHDALKLAEDTEIKLTLHGPPIAMVSSDQIHGYVMVRGSTRENAVVSYPDGSTSIKVFPMALGTVEFELSIVFADGGVALKKVKVDVGPGSRQPSRIEVLADDQGVVGPLRPLHLVWTDPSQPGWRQPDQGYILPIAFYDGLVSPIDIPARLVHYRVKTEGQQPVIALDPTNGGVKALRPGQALVQSEFGGQHFETCVVVVSAGPFERDLSNCRGLRANHAADLPAPDLDSLSTDAGRERALAAAKVLSAKQGSI